MKPESESGPKSSGHPPHAAPRVHASRLMRGFYLGAGVACIALGVAGLVLPVLPTTPFILLAAFCFGRASPRLHRWLLRSRTFGPMIREWQQHRAIPWRTKLTGSR